jgi:hypothetical protein
MVLIESTFTPAELAYLGSQCLGRLATLAPDQPGMQGRDVDDAERGAQVA